MPSHPYQHTVASHVYGFRDLKDLMAKATPLRSGDLLAGVAAHTAQERAAAQMALAELPLRTFLRRAMAARAAHRRYREGCCVASPGISPFHQHSDQDW